MTRRLYLETLLISLAVILLEVSYTRVFSFKLVYYFTYLIIGISLLGLGAGGVFVALFRGLRRMPASRLIPACCVAASGAVFGGYLVVAKTPLNAFDLINALSARAIRPALGEGAKPASPSPRSSPPRPSASTASTSRTCSAPASGAPSASR